MNCHCVLFVAGVFLAVLVASIGCLSQIQPATKPPQLYQSDTNLQMLLNLMANYSQQSLSCDSCSGVYQVLSHLFLRVCSLNI